MSFPPKNRGDWTSVDHYREQNTSSLQTQHRLFMVYGKIGRTQNKISMERAARPLRVTHERVFDLTNSNWAPFMVDFIAFSGEGACWEPVTCSFHAVLSSFRWHALTLSLEIFCCATNRGNFHGDRTAFQNECDTKRNNWMTLVQRRAT